MDEDDVLNCADCGAVLEDNDSRYENTQGDRICVDCAEDYVACADCDKMVSRDSEHRDENGKPICESCGEHYSVCGECGAVVHDDIGAFEILVMALPVSLLITVR